MRKNADWMGMLHERVLEFIYETSYTEVELFQQRCSLDASAGQVLLATRELVAAGLVIEKSDDGLEVTPEGREYLAGRHEPPQVSIIC